MNRKILALGMAASVLLLAGCSLLPSTTSTQSEPYDSTKTGGSGYEAGDPGAPSSDSTLSSTENQVVTTGTITISVDNPVAATVQAVTVVERAGGHVDNRTENAASDSQSARAYLTLRIPSDEITQILDDLKQLGTVESVSITASDVTTQVHDINARIAALQTSVDRLLDLMSRATTTTDLIALESALSERQSELDSLKAQRDSLADQVEYSSIELTLKAKGALPSGVPGDFWSGLGVGWASFVAALDVSLVVLGVALPWLAILGILVIIIVFIVRISTHKKKVTPVD